MVGQPATEIRREEKYEPSNEILHLDSTPLRSIQRAHPSHGPEQIVRAAAGSLAALIGAVSVTTLSPDEVVDCVVHASEIGDGDIIVYVFGVGVGGAAGGGGVAANMGCQYRT